MICAKPKASPEDTLPPHDESIERQVLATILSEESSDLLAQVATDDFYALKHQHLCNALKGLAASGKPVNVVEVYGYLMAIDKLEDAGGHIEIMALPDASPGAGTWPSLLESLKAYAIRRSVLDDAGRLSSLARDNQVSPAAISDAARRLLEAHADTGRQELHAKPLSQLVRHEDGDEQELIKHRWLCRGGAALLTGPAGVGKSALLMQMLLSFAICRAVFGIQPARRLKSVLVQAENDEGDLAEMRDGVIAGLGLTEAQRQEALDSVFCWREDVHTGQDFCRNVIRPLLGDLKPDLVAIDPALAYLGGDNNRQEIVGPFLRNGLNPLLHEFQVGGIVNHHSNKPPGQKREKADWSGSDLAYLGSGSAEWANWPRAILSLQSIGTFDTYKLVLGKRGKRLRWISEDGTDICEQHIAHAKDGSICWLPADPDTIPAMGRKVQFTKERLALWLEREDLSSTEWFKVASAEDGIGRAKFFELKRDCERAGLVKKSTAGKWAKTL